MTYEQVQENAEQTFIGVFTLSPLDFTVSRKDLRNNEEISIKHIETDLTLVFSVSVGTEGMEFAIQRGSFNSFRHKALLKIYYLAQNWLANDVMRIQAEMEQTSLDRLKAFYRNKKEDL